MRDSALPLLFCVSVCMPFYASPQLVNVSFPLCVFAVDVCTCTLLFLQSDRRFCTTLWACGSVLGFSETNGWGSLVEIGRSVWGWRMTARKM